jgi:hypothetical protein
VSGFETTSVLATTCSMYLLRSHFVEGLVRYLHNGPPHHHKEEPPEGERNADLVPVSSLFSCASSFLKPVAVVSIMPVKPPSSRRSMARTSRVSAQLWDSTSRRSSTESECPKDPQMPFNLGSNHCSDGDSTSSYTLNICLYPLPSAILERGCSPCE